MFALSVLGILPIAHNHGHSRSHATRHGTFTTNQRALTVIRIVLIVINITQQRSYALSEIRTSSSRSRNRLNTSLALHGFIISCIAQFQPTTDVIRQVLSNESSLIRVAQNRFHRIVARHNDIGRRALVKDVERRFARRCSTSCSRRQQVARYSCQLQLTTQSTGCRPLCQEGTGYVHCLPLRTLSSPNRPCRQQRQTR